MNCNNFKLLNFFTDVVEFVIFKIYLSQLVLEFQLLLKALCELLQFFVKVFNYKIQKAVVLPIEVG